MVIAENVIPALKNSLTKASIVDGIVTASTQTDLIKENVEARVTNLSPAVLHALTDVGGLVTRAQSPQH